MARFKNHLVLQLFVNNGPFWRAVSEARQRQGIVPTVEVPPPDFNSLGPMPYQEEVYRIRDAIVPSRFYETFTFDWLGFIAACLMYQPPRTRSGLVGLAAFGSGPYPYTFVAAAKPSKLTDEPPPRLDDSPGPDELPSPDDAPQMLAPPIREFRDEDGAFRYDITVDEHTTEADVREAYRKIRAILKERSQGGAPQRDQFIAVQCAILYDEENPRDPSDGRRRRWTYAKLADEFRLGSGRAAKLWVEAGRQILTGKVTVQ